MRVTLSYLSIHIHSLTFQFFPPLFLIRTVLLLKDRGKWRRFHCLPPFLPSYTSSNQILPSPPPLSSTVAPVLPCYCHSTVLLLIFPEAFRILVATSRDPTRIPTLTLACASTMISFSTGKLILCRFSLFFLG